jgi:hypothetical protein
MGDAVVLPVAAIDQRAVIDRILRHLGLPTDLPPLGRARGALSGSRRAVPRPARAPPLDEAARGAASDGGTEPVFETCA